MFDVVVVGKCVSGDLYLFVGEFELNVWVCVLFDDMIKLVVYKYDLGIGMCIVFVVVVVEEFDVDLFCVDVIMLEDLFFVDYIYLLWKVFLIGGSMSVVMEYEWLCCVGVIVWVMLVVVVVW